MLTGVREEGAGAPAGRDGASGGRRRIRMINRVVETSGRRFDRWGAWYATYVHFRVGLTWYFGCDAHTLHRLYKRLYGDIR